MTKPADDHAHRSRLMELIGLYDRLGDDERDLILLLTQRLVMGRERYGALRVDEDHRDMRQESLEEIADALVYAGAEMVRLQRR